MRYLKSILAQDETISTSTSVTYDLPINPLSFIMMNIIAAQNAAGTELSYADVLNIIDKIEVLFKGSSIMSFDNMKDLAFMSSMITKMLPLVENWGNENNLRLSVPVIIPFGRRLYDPEECFPPTRRGELQLKITYASSLGDSASAKMQIETVELLEANPLRFLKMTDFSKTPTATGAVDVDLPIGNKILGIGLFSTTVPSGSSGTTTINKVELLLDNVETYLAETNWESLHAEMSRRIPPARINFTHTHTENTAASYVQNATTDPQQIVNCEFNNYAYIDFDPIHDLNYLLETAGLGRAHLRIDAGDTNALRAIPIEVIELQAPTGA
jgi:hypothetical protein